MDKDQAELDPGESHMALAGPDLKPTHDEFMANVYPNIHESFKFPANEHVILEDPLSSTGTLSSMKNLDDAFTIRDQVFTLELRDLLHKIDETIHETVKEAVHVALQAPLRDRFRDLPEADMKEMLHQRIFESGSYKSHLEHVALYEALEASMKPPQSSVWKTSDTREAPSSSSKQQFGPYFEKPVEYVPMPDTAHISDSEDTDYAHVLKIKPRPEWLKPIREEDRPATPEPD
ncbi:hypothetical protein Tco_1243807 [Tanacetum coccineum]